MSRTLSWLPRIEEIRTSVRNSVRSHYGRRDLELLFKLQPRAAGKLLDTLPTVEVGRSLLVEREALGRFLDAVNEAEDVRAAVLEQREQKGRVDRRVPRRLVMADFEPLDLAGLPSSVEMAPGRIVVRFATGEELVETFVLISRVFQTDFEDFCQRFEPARPAQPEREREAAALKQMFDELDKQEAAARGVTDDRTCTLCEQRAVLDTMMVCWRCNRILCTRAKCMDRHREKCGAALLPTSAAGEVRL